MLRNTLEGIVPTLHLHRDAEADLEAIDQTDPFAAGFIVALLQELGSDPDLMDRLTQHRYDVQNSGDWAANFSVSRWIEQSDQGRNLWRLKSWELTSEGCHYRIVYAFDPTTFRHHVLGIFPRSEFDYESDNPRTERVLRAYAAI